MTKRTSFLTRCLSMLLVLAMLLSNVNMGFAMRASAAETTLGAVLVENYGLTGAANELISGGFLKETTNPILYEEFVADGLVSVDTVNKKITANPYGTCWMPVSVVLEADGQDPENVELVNGEWVYKSTAEAFTVKVSYEYQVGIPHAAILNAGADINAAMQGIATASATVDATRMEQIEGAMETLNTLATTGYGEGDFKIAIQDEVAKNAVVELWTMMGNYGGVLPLTAINKEYTGAASKVQYLLSKAAEFEAAYVVHYNLLSALAADTSIVNNSLLPNMIAPYAGSIAAGAVKNFQSALKEQVAAMDTVIGTVNGAKWEDKVAAVKTDLSDAQYIHMDGLVPNATTGKTEQLPLTIAKAAPVVVGMDMQKIAISVTVKTTSGKADDAVLVAKDPYEVTVTVKKGAEDALASVEAKVADILAELGVDPAHFTVASLENTIPEGKLEQDAAYTVVYEPVQYDVTPGYVDSDKAYHGYVLTLPNHPVSEQSYDYIVTMNGVKTEGLVQGNTITITGDTEISAIAGKARHTIDVYTTVGEFSGNATAKGILETDALYADKKIGVRRPDPDSDPTLIQFTGTQVTATAEYPADLGDLVWVPYDFGTDTDKTRFNGTTGTFTGDSVIVRYGLNLSSYVSAQDYVNIMTTVKEVNEQADSQIKAISALKDIAESMKDFNSSIVRGALPAAVESTTFSTDAEKNAAVQARFLEALNTLNAKYPANEAGCVSASTGNMYLYDLMQNVNDLMGYWKYSEDLIKAVNNLSAVLNKLYEGENAQANIQAMVETLKNDPTVGGSVPQDIDTILLTLKEDVDSLKSLMHPKHTAIDLNNPNLGALVNFLKEDNGTVTVPSAADVYALSPDFSVAKEGKVQVVIDVYLGGTYNPETASVEGGNYMGSYKTEVVDKGSVPSDLADVIAAAEAGMDNDLYALTATAGAKVDSLTAADMETSQKAFYIFTPKEFTVKIGDASYTVGLGTTMSITLPATGSEPAIYNKFVIKEETYLGGETYTFSSNDLKAMFVDGVFTLTYETIDRNEAAMENAFGDCKTVKPIKENGKTVALAATVDGDGKDGIMAFAKDLINNGEFDFVALNDQIIMFKDEQGDDKMRLQGLIDALLHDDAFGSEKIISLNDNKGGQMLSKATITLGVYGDAKTRSNYEVYFNQLPFTLNLTGVPAKLADVAKGLKEVRSYFSFTGNSQTGKMDVELNIPGQLYGAYVAALVAANDLDKTNMAEMDKVIARQFLQDYVFDLLENPDITAETYANTVNRVINQANNVAGTTYNEIDAKRFEKYYNIVHNMFLDKDVTLTTIDGDTAGSAADYTAHAAAAGKGVLSLAEGFGLDLSLFENAIVERQDGVDLIVNADINVNNLDVDYQAMVIDVRGAGSSTAATVAQKFDFTNNLPARVNQITGEAAILLTGDVTGNLNFQGTTILDLNGHTINGSVNANGKLFIVDSTMDINSVGGVTGNVTGNVTILGGNYAADVTAFLKDGFIQQGGKVMNSLYHFENGGIAIHPSLFDPEQFGGKEDYITSAKYMAVDLAVDIALNYYTVASLSADKNVLVEYAFTDILGMLTQDTKAETVGAIVDRVLDCINLDGGVDTFTNTVLADLLNIQNIYDCTYGENGKSVGPFAVYEIGITDYKVDVYHQTSGDYITADLVRDDATYRAKNFPLFIATELIPDQYADNFKQALLWLATTVVEEDTFVTIDLDDITRDGKNIHVGGGAETSVALDFSHDVHPYKPGETVDPTFYNKMLATMLAYGSDTVEAELAKYTDADGKLRDLNKAMFDVLDKITVGTFFEGLEKACESDVTIQQMIDKVGFIELEAEYIEKMQSAYDKVKATVLKVITKYDLTSIAKQPMAKYNDGSYTYTFSADMKDHTLDAFYKGYGVIANLKESKATLKIILVDDYRIVFDTTDADENVIKSLGDLWINDQCVTDELEGNTIWLKEAPTADFAVSYTYYDTTAMTTYEHMYVWKITVDPTNSRLYHATRIEALDDVLKFNGASVWMGPDQVGLAFAYNAITEAQIKAFETELGYKIALENEGYGTVLGSWNSDAIPVLDLTDGAHYRYRDTYSDINGVAYCGNHIRELTMDFVDKTINGRFFIRLEKIGAENADTVLYSGLVTRSMYYVADQNRNVTFGAPYDGYIDNILNYVEG